MKLFFSVVITLVILGFDATVSHSAVIEGCVYLDANQNGRWDDGETGAPGVLVSDGRRVAATDASGRYRLESDDARATYAIWSLMAGRSRIGPTPLPS